MLRYLEGIGVPGVFVSGTTGEFTALDDDERAAVLSAALTVFGADAVYAHVGAAAARQAERLTAQAVALGARRLAAITPFYLPADPAALMDYYRRLAAVAGDARIYVYLFAARTGVSVTPGQLADLATIPAVAGAKISGELRAVVLQYVDAVPDDFEVYSGNDVEFGDFVRAGTGDLRGPGPGRAGRARHRRGQHRAAEGRAVAAGPAGRPHQGGARPANGRATALPTHRSQ